ncbi:MAG: Primosomal protein N' [candidate division WS2 bacterium ADurb.Bin280]|uniref:Primosomal protein N n=1 Tax=candidate division WS2 bacterium ADurb.Bin280 TaxID=1852829 RepID=A0A1V5SFM4_9BACT|nr:MAG: Primosomal protein N' [candidate division WS2 bacterium ADurb.Bin280]
MYVYKVIPKLRSSSQDSFDYLSDSPLEFGQIVEISFGKSKTFGAIVGQTKKSKFATKKVIRIVSSGRVFTQKQLLLAQQLSSQYLRPLGETLFSFLPTMNIGDIKKLSGRDNSFSKFKNKAGIYVSSQENRESYYLQQSLLSNNQVLIVLPEIDRIKKLSFSLKKIAPQKKVFQYHSFLKSQQKAKIWNHLISGKEAIIIGTRQSLLLPFSSLELICIDDPLDFAYDEDQSPYYQAFFVARRLREIFSTSLIIGESIPSVTSFVGYLQKKLTLTIKKEKRKVSILDSFNNFSKQLSFQKFILQKVQSRSKICFVGPWKNQTKLRCVDCNNEVICKNCQNSYFNQSNGVCAKCTNQTDLCPNCQSPNLKNFGFSYKAIEQSLERSLPQIKNSISPSEKIDQSKNIFILNPSEAAKSSIQFDAIIFPYFDLMKNFASLGYRHKIFRLIYNLPILSDAKIILMGENLNDDKFTSQVKNFDFESFLRDETLDRKKFQMPPFGKAIEIISKAGSEDLVKDKLMKLSKNLNLDIMTLRSDGTKKTKTAKGLFFVATNKWESFKKDLKKALDNKTHLRIDRSDYL